MVWFRVLTEIFMAQLSLAGRAAWARFSAISPDGYHVGSSPPSTELQWQRIRAAQWFPDGAGNFYGRHARWRRRRLRNEFSWSATNGSLLSVLHDFAGGFQGANPYGGLIQGSDGNFYGTTENYATVFQLTPLGGFTTLSSFFRTPRPDTQRHSGPGNGRELVRLGRSEGFSRARRGILPSVDQRFR